MAEDKGSLLFVCYGGGHVASCLPVAEELESRGWVVYFLALTSAVKYANGRCRRVIGFKDFITAEDVVAHKYSDRLVSSDASDVVPIEESRAYLGLSYQDLVLEVGEDKAASVYARHGRQAFSPVHTMRRIFSLLKPDGLVTTASPRAEHTAQVVAQELGIPRFYILDMADPFMIDRISSLPHGAIVCTADLTSQNKLIEKGFDRQHIFITGNPAFDSLRDCTPDAINLYRQEIGVAPGGRVILWASQPEPAIHPFTGAKGDIGLPRKIEEILRTWIASRPLDRLIVRYHPSEDLTFVAGGNVVFSSRSSDPSLVLNACDVLVTMTSTMALQAIELGKVVVFVNMSIFSCDFFLPDLGLSVGVDDMVDLPCTLDAILDSGSLIAGALQGGGAALRVADLVEKYLGS